MGPGYAGLRSSASPSAPPLIRRLRAGSCVAWPLLPAGTSLWVGGAGAVALGKLPDRAELLASWSAIDVPWSGRRG